MKTKTWKVVELGEGFEPDGKIALACPKCWRDAEMPFREWPGNGVIAAIGLGLIFDRQAEPPFQMMPLVIECRGCHSVYTAEQEKEVV